MMGSLYSAPKGQNNTAKGNARDRSFPAKPGKGETIGIRQVAPVSPRRAVTATIPRALPWAVLFQPFGLGRGPTTRSAPLITNVPMSVIQG